MTKTRSARETTHTCMASKCYAQVPNRYLMCRQHWYQVPEVIRREIWASWAEVQTSGILTDRYIAVVAATQLALNAQRCDTLQQAQQVNDFTGEEQTP